MLRPHLAIDVTDPTRVGESRRIAVRLAAEQGLDEVARGRVALVVTELGHNLRRHAQRGRLLIAAGAGDDGPVVEVISLDHGPGMAEPERCLADGYSTAGTPGTGLGAVRRLADTFSLFSQPGAGTVIVTRIVQRPLAEAAARPASPSAATTGPSRPTVRSRPRSSPTAWATVRRRPPPRRRRCRSSPRSPGAHRRRRR